MAQKTKKENKKQKDNNKLVGAIAAIAAAVMVIAVIVAVALGGSSKLNDGYFVSDETKYVLTIDAAELSVSEEEEEYVPLKAHVVYDYEGDNVTGMRTYYEYGSSAEAKAAYDYIMEDADNLDGIEEITVDGKYVVLVAPDYNYEGMTVDDVKAQIEFVEMLQNVDTEDWETEETTEETTEEE